MSGYDGLSEITANVCQVDYINAKSRVSDKCPGGGDWYERGWGSKGARVQKYESVYRPVTGNLLKSNGVLLDVL